MKRILFAAAVALAGLPTLSHAQTSPATDALSACAMRSVSSDESIIIARWLFIAMSRHPGLPQATRVSDSDGLEANRQMGRLVNLLLFERCAAETRTAIQAVGQETALDAVFGTLGEKAMMDLMGNSEVLASVIQLGAFVDVQRLNEIGAAR